MLPSRHEEWLVPKEFDHDRTRRNSDCWQHAVMVGAAFKQRSLHPPLLQEMFPRGDSPSLSSSSAGTIPPRQRVTDFRVSWLGSKYWRTYAAKSLHRLLISRLKVRLLRGPPPVTPPNKRTKIGFGFTDYDLF